MNKHNVIKKDTLIPVGVLAGTLTALTPAIIYACSYVNDYMIKFDVQASEYKAQATIVSDLKNRQEAHESRSELQMLSIEKVLSRIEGKLDSRK